ncbi:UbiH/UbiF/VisC/COQ6 family ubiquinone biosynthesis hydroxylase [Motiliproteus sediminis]|uniref:UbiH/UbiF/VisC/COQ6 family ubiquinone biosynthesis hydroxylase n=1 Tax=Motiliproteus sediminis TaxID=1468178 RepID=UPI001AF01D78|nr:UbiH/UbiF/VisC/COQ6 family ubiquinone biosynthesis hydroxylase [Motiliproteus sediminis]
MSAEPTDVDVVIAGGGMVGLTVACALGSSGLSVAVIEPRPDQDDYRALRAGPDAPFDPRVSALTDASRAILQGVGAWPLMARLRMQPYRRMQVWDGPGTSEICFDAAELQRAHLGHIVENRVTLAALARVVSGHQSITRLDGARIAELQGPQPGAGGLSRRQLTLEDGRVLRSRLVVAADGARSPTRALAGLTVSEWDYQHDALVTTLRLAQPHQSTAWQCFTEQGPLAFLPLPALDDGYHRVSIVWSTPPAHARELLALDEAAFCRRIALAFDQRFDVLGCDARHSFPLTQRHAPHYVDDGIALVGDAAHTIHPLAGQGVNLGLLDAATLAEEVQAAVAQQADFSDLRILRRYQRRRQGENLKMMGLMAAFRHLYGDVPPAVQWLRNFGLRQVGDCLPLRQLLSAQALGLGGSLPRMARG